MAEFTATMQDGTMAPKHVARELAFSNPNACEVVIQVQTMMTLSWVHFVITTEATRQTNF